MRIFLLLLLLILGAPLQAKQLIDSKVLFDNAVYSQVMLSSEGNYISYVEKAEDKRVISLFNIKSKDVHTLLTLDSGEVISDFAWLNEQQVFLTLKQDGRLNSYIVDIDLVNPMTIDNFTKIKGVDVINTLPSDPLHVMITLGPNKKRKKKKLVKLSIEQLKQGNYESGAVLDTVANNLERYVYDDNLHRIIKIEFDEDNEKVAIKWRKLGSRKWQLVFELEDQDDYFYPETFIDDSRLAILSNKHTDKIALYEFDLATQTLGKKLFEHGDYDLVSAEFNLQGQLEWVSYFQKGKLTRHYLNEDKMGLQKRLQKTLNDQMVFIVDTHKPKNISLIYTEASNIPGDYYLYDHANDRLEHIFNAFPELKDLSFAKTKNIMVKTVDGTVLEAFLTKPISEDKNTLLVMPHGGPIDVQETDGFNQEIQYLVNRGFSVLRVNFRGSSGFGKAFLHQGVGQFGKRIEEDISAVVAHVLTDEKYDNVCSIGSSYGGYSAMMLAIKRPDIYKCVIAAYGIYDLPLLFNSSNYKATDEYREMVAKVVGEQSEEHRKYSPLYLLDQLEAPVLLIAGDKDKISGVEQSNRLKYLLKRHGIPVESVFYRHVGHGHHNWYGERHQSALVVDFLLRKLGLPLPHQTELSDHDKKILKEEYIQLGDVLDNNSSVNREDGRSLPYYRVAAELGDARSLFNFGAYYHRGEEVEKNISKAIEYYKRSADLDAEFAHRRLGNLYYRGKLVATDIDKAFEHYQKAYELKGDNVNRLNFAKMHCLGAGIEKDVSKCVELLKINSIEGLSYDDKSELKNYRRELFAQVFAEGIYDQDELKLLNSLLTEMYSLNFFEYKFDVDETGFFKFEESERYGRKGEYVQVTEESVYTRPNDEELTFGVYFTTNKPGIDNRKDRTAVIIYWTSIDENGNHQRVHSSILWGSPRDDWNSLYTSLAEDDATKYQLKVYNLNRELVHKQEFTIQ